MHGHACRDKSGSACKSLELACRVAAHERMLVPPSTRGTLGHERPCGTPKHRACKQCRGIWTLLAK